MGRKVQLLILIIFTDHRISFIKVSPCLQPIPEYKQWQPVASQEMGDRNKKNLSAFIWQFYNSICLIPLESRSQQASASRGDSPIGSVYLLVLSHQSVMFKYQPLVLDPCATEMYFRSRRAYWPLYSHTQVRHAVKHLRINNGNFSAFSEIKNYMISLLQYTLHKRNVRSMFIDFSTPAPLQQGFIIAQTFNSGFYLVHARFSNKMTPDSVFWCLGIWIVCHILVKTARFSSVSGTIILMSSSVSIHIIRGKTNQLVGTLRCGTISVYKTLYTCTQTPTYLIDIYLHYL